METAPHDVQGIASSSEVRLLSPEPAFEDVYREHFAFVWSTLLRLGVPRPGVEDAVQDVFVVVHRRLSDFEGRGAGLRSWLFTIVRRVAYRHRRGVQRADRKHRALAQVRTRPIEMDEALDQRTAANVLMEALDQLDHDKRVALNLHVFEGLSGPQIAQMLEINVDTAYSRIKAARRRLQRSLKASGHGDLETLVEAARQQTRPPRGARRKVAAALGLQWKSAAPAVTGISGLKAALLGIALGGVAAVAVVGARSESTDPVATSSPSSRGATPGTSADREGHGPSVPVAAARSPEPTPQTERVVAPDAPEPAPARRARTRAGAAESPTPEPIPTPDAQLAAEVELLTQAKRALAGDPERTLRLLATHAERFPNGQLGTERAGYRAIALCTLGRWAQGRGEARLFVSAHGRSSLATRVTKACEISGSNP